MHRCKLTWSGIRCVPPNNKGPLVIQSRPYTIWAHPSTQHKQLPRSPKNRAARVHPPTQPTTSSKELQKHGKSRSNYAERVVNKLTSPLCPSQMDHRLLEMRNKPHVAEAVSAFWAGFSEGSDMKAMKWTPPPCAHVKRPGKTQCKSIPEASAPERFGLGGAFKGRVWRGGVHRSDIPCFLLWMAVQKQATPRRSCANS